ncbi:MAG: hypothetical protein LUD17_15720, partial [Bacteroidales bacterium]|nr:hypothetical protein [Bacteroidales bacterium]
PFCTVGIPQLTPKDGNLAKMAQIAHFGANKPSGFHFFLSHNVTLFSVFPSGFVYLVKNH